MFVLTSFLLTLALIFDSSLASIDELLECRANLTNVIKNQTAFVEKVQSADYIFTGKMKSMNSGLLEVRVKRVVKGSLSENLELSVNDTCAKYIRNSYTGIFMGKIVPDHSAAWMHFGPVPLTLANLDRLNAAVKGWQDYFEY